MDIACGVVVGRWWSNPPTTTKIPRWEWRQRYEQLAYLAGPGPDDFTVLLRPSGQITGQVQITDDSMSVSGIVRENDA